MSRSVWDSSLRSLFFPSWSALALLLDDPGGSCVRGLRDRKLWPAWPVAAGRGLGSAAGSVREEPFILVALTGPIESLSGVQSPAPAHLVQGQCRIHS